MIDSLNNWVSLVISIIFVPGVIWLFRSWINGVKSWKTDTNSRLDKIIEKLSLYATKNAEQDGRITNVEERLKNGDKRLNDHAVRIRDMEHKQAKCKSYKD